MTKQDLVNKVSEVTGTNKTETEKTVQAVLDTIVDGVNRGEKVNIHGFGVFTVVDRAAKKARNPKTGETVDVPASRKPKFSPGKNFKMAVNS